LEEKFLVLSWQGTFSEICAICNAFLFPNRPQHACMGVF
jgi:hypothetical protein